MKTLRPQNTTRNRTPLVLRPLQEKLTTSLLLGWMLCWCCDAWNGAPPLIYIVGSHPLLGRGISREHLEPTLWANQRVPHRSLKVVGPMGWSAGQVGRPASQWAHQPSSCSIGLLLMSTCWWSRFGPLFCWVSSLVGLLIHVRLVWRYRIGRCFLLGQKGYDCPPFSAKTCTHRNLEGHVEFGDLLVAWV